jgi:uncharacterized membrane protein YgcG
LYISLKRIVDFFKTKLITLTSNESGSVILNIAILASIGGIIIGGSVNAIRSVDRETQTEITREKMQKVITALSLYTQKQNQVPCPADPAGAGPEPFGAQRGSGAGGLNNGLCTNAADALGIVPFKTLGLNEDDARDEWGNYFTFRVSTSLGNNGYDPSLPQNHPSQPLLHDMCREMGVWVFPSTTGPNMHIDPAKAAFCCPQPDPSFDVIDRNNDSYVPDALNCSGGSCGGSYGRMQTPAPPGSIPAGSELPDVLAVVLLSHGRNGFGAFLRDGSRIDNGNFASYSAAEQENSDNDGIFMLFGPATEAENNYYDDLIAWRTQALLMTELGGTYSNCDEPMGSGGGGGGSHSMGGGSGGGGGGPGGGGGGPGGGGP